MGAAWALSACGSAGSDSAGTAAGGDTTQVIASIYPLELAAERIGGDSVTVRNLTPPGVEPHDLELAPRDFQQLRSADLLLFIGEGFQPALEGAAEGADGIVLDVLTAPGLELQHLDTNAGGRGDEESRSGAAIDPHVWLDPLAFGAIAAEIGRKLGDEGDAADFQAELAELEAEFRSGLADCRRDEVVTSHAAFGYLTERYGLRQVSIAGLSPEDEPTPRDLERVIETVRDTGAKVVFFETLASPKLAETVARETGARTAVLNPIEGLTEDERDAGDDYFSIMRTNLRALRDGLECQ